MHLSQGILKYHMYMKQDDPRITLGNLGPGNQKYTSHTFDVLCQGKLAMFVIAAVFQGQFICFIPPVA